ncbi:hypothetical protein ACQ0QQ_20110 [Lysinibacillus sphaericus]
MPRDELAERRWKSIPADIRKELESNVYCINCNETTITDYEVEYEHPHIILNGYCKKCRGGVTRVID